MTRKMRFYSVECKNCGTLSGSVKMVTLAKDSHASMYRMTVERDLKDLAADHNCGGRQVKCNAKVKAWDAELAFTLTNR